MEKIILVLVLISGSLLAQDAKNQNVNKCEMYETRADTFMKIAEKRWKGYEDVASASSMSAMYSSMYIKDCSIDLITLPDGTECVKNSSPRCSQMPTTDAKL